MRWVSYVVSFLAFFRAAFSQDADGSRRSVEVQSQGGLVQMRSDAGSHARHPDPRHTRREFKFPAADKDPELLFEEMMEASIVDAESGVATDGSVLLEEPANLAPAPGVPTFEGSGRASLLAVNDRAVSESRHLLTGRENAGPKGPAGESGEPGPAGPMGKKGKLGKAGARGDPGKTGIGIPGAPGDVGAKGVPGKQGEKGTQGASGPPGVKGPLGKHGKRGKAGKASPKVDCKWGAWLKWEDCTKSCAGGRKRRDRVVKTAPANGGKTCVGRSFQYSDCNAEPCIVVADIKETTTKAPVVVVKAAAPPRIRAAQAFVCLLLPMLVHFLAY